MKRFSAFALFVVITFLGYSQSYNSKGFGHEVISRSLTRVSCMTMLPDGRLIVGETSGEIHVVENDVIVPELALKIQTTTGEDKGLIGLVADPDFESNGYIYACFTDPTEVRNKIVRYTMTGNSLDESSEYVLIELETIGGWHVGGSMVFDTTGCLLTCTGDGSNGAVVQDMTNWYGKVLRLNTDGTYPIDNPYVDSADAKTKYVYATGLRNPYTMTVHPETGVVMINDVGADSTEEINHLMMAGNYGWPLYEGFAGDVNYDDPVYTYDHTEWGSGSDREGNAITGGAFITAQSGFPSNYLEKYIFTDFSFAWLNVIDPFAVDVAASRETFAENLPENLPTVSWGGMVALTEGNGGIYFASLNTFTLYKIVYEETNEPEIVAHPRGITAFEGTTLSNSVSAVGALPLTYQWYYNGAPLTCCNYSEPTLTLWSADVSRTGEYHVEVTNSFGTVSSDTIYIEILDDSEQPIINIVEPVANDYYAGQLLTLSADVEDFEGNPVPDSLIVWEVEFHHAEHTHPTPPIDTGTSITNYTIPVAGELSDDVLYRIHVYVVKDPHAANLLDISNISGTTYKDILPITYDLTITTIPEGLNVGLGALPSPTPITATLVQGVEFQLLMDSLQTLGVDYHFDSWSNGGSATHTTYMADEDLTLTATFSVIDGLLDKQENELVTIYPTVVTEVIHVKAEKKSELSMLVIDSYGRVVIEESKLQTGTIQVSELSTGNYFLIVQDSFEYQTLQFHKN
jgi:glucose/arabinose dehydrogenase